MKKIVFVFGVLLGFLAVNTYGQESLYVSAGGRSNIGFSEAAPGNSLINALLLAKHGNVKKITVIGTLDMDSDVLSREFISDNGAVLVCLIYRDLVVTAILKRFLLQESKGLLPIRELYSQDEIQGQAYFLFLII